MRRKLDAEDLVGAAEIAERLGLAVPQTVHDWRRRYDSFPRPVAELRMGMIWSWAEVLAWARETGRADGY